VGDVAGMGVSIGGETKGLLGRVRTMAGRKF
jgi:hypothetical protein